ncbi:sorting nexin [Globomyces sp. JEL0801]|nr:sorting nexin [Globomyces sp. JEL0801]
MTANNRLSMNPWDDDGLESNEPHKLDDTLLFSGSYYDNDPIAAYKNILNNSATLNDKDKPVDVPVDPYKVLMGETIGSSNTSPYSEQFDESNFKNQNHYMNQDPLSSSNLYNSDGAISSTFPTTSVYAGNSDDPWKTADSLEIPPPKGVNINVVENNEPESDPYVSPGGEDYLLANDTIDVQTSNESSGHLFGHVTFIVTSKFHEEMLLKIYGFRIVTSLPPKKAVGMDNAFIERRRRGLLRFISFIGNFEYTKTLQNYRNSQPIFYDEEFLTLQLTEAMISGIPADLDDRITDFRKNLTNHTDLVCTMTNTLERFLTRLKG